MLTQDVEVTLQPEWAIAVVERASESFWVRIAALTAALPAIGVVWAPPALDVALLGASAAVVGIGYAAARLRRRVDRLPLEIAPVVGTGIVDGVRVYRFRVRLGRGRRVALPVATVSFLDEDGDRYAMPAEVPADQLWGPFTVLVADPHHRCVGPGRFEVQVSCQSAGDTWRAAASLDRDGAREGWFTGPEVRGGRVAFPADWAALVRPGER